MSTKITSVAVQSSTVDSTPIGQTTPAQGIFTAAQANTFQALVSATAPTVSASDNSLNIATTAWAKLGLTVSLSSNGYVKFPTWLGGLVVQWGNTGTLPDSSQQLVTYPTPFPTGAFVIIGTMSNNIGSNVRTIQCVPVSASTFNIQANGSSATAFWLAVGR